MNEVEQQLSDLLRRAPGEPPHALDVDAVLAHEHRRWRRAGPAIGAVAAATVAVVVGVATGLTSTSRPAAPPASPTVTGVSTPPSNPKAAAMTRIEAAMRAAPLPPGARRAGHELPNTGQVATSTSPNEVRRTTWWTAPGTLAAAVDYIVRHRPQGMRIDSSGSALSKSGSVSSMTYDFATTPTNGGYGLELDYVIAPYQAGVAIRVDTWTVWAPIRPSWSYAPAAATSAQVTIVRRPLFKATNGPSPGAPTVARTLTGPDAQHLAQSINTVPSVAPEGIHSCPPPNLDARDTVVFHTAAGDLVFTQTGDGCSPNTAVTDPRNHRTTTFINGAKFEAIVLVALGLPTNYGHQR
jgi:hypothetical protein